MNIPSSKTAPALRLLAALTSTLLLGALSAGCASPAGGDTEDEEAVGEARSDLNGFGTWSWGTTTDTTGIDIGAMSTQTCVLSGVNGNLNIGGQWQQDVESTAWVWGGGTDWTLLAHGGAYTNQTNQRVWQNNPVLAAATCFFTTTNLMTGEWDSFTSNFGPSPPVKIASLDPNNQRQCYLGGLWGVGGAWNSSSTFARVIKKTSTDATHPTTGWYIESNIVSPADGSHARVFGTCVDFPAGTAFTASTVAGPVTNQAITSGTGIKGCGLFSVKGAFNQNSWTNGAVVNPPDQIDGNWTLTVSSGKTAGWQCAN